MLEGHRLFQTALRLAGWRPNPPPFGPLAPYENMPVPPEEDLRRSISTAYYALFHRLLEVMTDYLLGVESRGTADYNKLCRSFSHIAVARSCKKADTDVHSKQHGIRLVARNFVEARTRRESADYDIEMSFEYEAAVAQIARVNNALVQLVQLDKAAIRELAVGSLVSTRRE